MKIFLAWLLMLTGIGVTVHMASCTKTALPVVVPITDNSDSTDSARSGSGRLSYGDSLFFLRYTGPDYIISPITRPSVNGYFKSNPEGLVLDSLSGSINVSQSVGGVKYKVYYMDNLHQRVDSVRLIISGIDYRDGIYELRSTPVAYDTAFPVYNTRTDWLLPCGTQDLDGDGGLDDDDNLCIFDETDLDDNGDDDINGVNQDKLLVDEKKGTIDLEASFHAGVFGSSTPANGIIKDFTFYYRLNDASNRALNKITVRLFHYRYRADIPDWLLEEMGQRRANTATVYSRPAPVTAKRQRPPIIIIVSDYQ